MDSLLGLASVIGRLAIGYACDLGISSLFLSALCSLVSGITLMIIPLNNTYWFYATFCFIHGSFAAAHIVLNSPILIESMGKEDLPSLLIVLLTCRGFGILFGDYFGGLLFDTTESILPTCVCGGVFFVIGAVLLECCHIYKIWFK